jgi:hypothetical protein
MLVLQCGVAQWTMSQPNAAARALAQVQGSCSQVLQNTLLLLR